MAAPVHGAGDIKTHMDSGFKEFSLAGKMDTCISQIFHYSVLSTEIGVCRDAAVTEERGKLSGEMRYHKGWYFQASFKRITGVFQVKRGINVPRRVNISKGMEV